jgi:hypothetical protein
MPIKATEGEYKGSATLTIEWDGKEPDRYPFSIGIGKAKKVLAAHDEIKAFVEKHRNDPPRPRAAQPAQLERGAERTEAPAGERQERLRAE